MSATTSRPTPAECPHPRLKFFLSRRGIRLVTCTACRAIAPVEDAPKRVKATTQNSRPKPVDKPSGYACPEHGRPVNWRGQGCRDCEGRK